MPTCDIAQYVPRHTRVRKNLHPIVIMLHVSTSRADHRFSCSPEQHPPHDTDSDEYGSFDEEELELLNDIFEHSLPAGQASGGALPVLNISSQPITYPSLDGFAKPVTLSSLEAFEGQFDDPEYEDDVEASEQGCQKPRLRRQMAARNDVLEVQLDESVLQPSTTGIPSCFF